MYKANCFKNWVELTLRLLATPCRSNWNAFTRTTFVQWKNTYIFEVNCLLGTSAKLRQRCCTNITISFVNYPLNPGFSGHHSHLICLQITLKPRASKRTGVFSYAILIKNHKLSANIHRVKTDGKFPFLIISIICCVHTCFVFICCTNEYWNEIEWTGLGIIRLVPQRSGGEHICMLTVAYTSRVLKIRGKYTIYVRNECRQLNANYRT